MEQKPETNKNPIPVTTAQTTTPTNTMSAQPVQPDGALPPKPKGLNKKKVILITLVVLVFAIAAGGYYLWSSHKSTPKQSNDVTTKVAVDKKICFTFELHLVCTDIAGKNRIRYDLPKLPNGFDVARLITNLEQTSYLATTSSNGDNAIWLLDPSLKVVKQLKFDNQIDPSSNAVLTQDGKSALVSVISKEKVEIVKYDLDSDKITVLTTSSDSSGPQETKGGKILYSTFVSDTGSSYIMDADGKNQQKVKDFGGSNEFVRSYDIDSDTLFILSNSDNQNAKLQKLTYGKLDDFSSSDTSKTKNIPVASSSSSGDFVLRISEESVLVINSMDQTAKIYNLSSGEEIGSIDYVGTPAGMLDVSKFKASAIQERQVDDRIENINLAPADFQTYIKKEIVKHDTECSKDADKKYDSIITIYNTVRNSFVQTSEGCIGLAGGYSAIYAKSANGTWTQAYAGQDAPTCSAVNKYKLPKSMVNVCYNGTENVPVTNP